MNKNKEKKREKFMNKKLMALILSGVMLFRSVGFTQAADFSDGTIVEDSSINNDERENLPEDFTDDEMLNSFTDARVDTNNTIFDPAITDSSLNDDEIVNDEEIEELSVATAGEKNSISGKCGNNLEWTFKNGTLTISGSGKMYNYYWEKYYYDEYDYIDRAPWKACAIKKIIIKKGVTSIGEFAFYRCRELVDVNISETVKSIGVGAFNECYKMTKINIPKSVEHMGGDAFIFCKNLTSITLPESITRIESRTFGCCEKLKKIEIPNSVTYIGDGAFWDCYELEDIVLSDKINFIGSSAFRNCDKLKNFIFPQKVSVIKEETFCGSGLINIGISSNVTSIERKAFYNCTKLKNIYYSGNDTQWKKITINTGNDNLMSTEKHYNSTLPSDFDNQAFKLTSYSSFIVGEPQLTGIQVDYTASTPGNVANEAKQINWSSSDPSIAEVDLKSASYTDTSDKNSTHGTINLLTYDAGEITITGTSADGRTATIQVSIEPKLMLNDKEGYVKEETDIPVCSVKLKREDRKYLESYINSLDVKTKGEYTRITKKKCKIADDGKSAELICTVQPFSNVENAMDTIICTSPNGQKIEKSIGSGSDKNSFSVNATYDNKSKKKELHWTKNGYNESEIQVNVQISNASDSIKLEEISMELSDLKMFKIKDASIVTNIGSDYTYTFKENQTLNKGKTLTFQFKLEKKGLTWWKPNDGAAHNGKIYVKINGKDSDNNQVDSSSLLELTYQNDIKKQQTVDDEQQAIQ